MNKEFVPYQLSLDLKELGFNEPCFGYYNGQGNYIGEEGKMNSNCNKLGMHGAYCTAPLYQQSFRWFREKYKLSGTPQYFTGGFYCYTINDMKDTEKSNRLFTEFETYEETELACLIELIVIVKNKKR
jgi:hypothetical protein